MDAIVLDLGPGEVEGECLLQGEVGKILCLSYEYTVTMPMSWDVTNMKRTIGKSTFEDVSLTKKLDIATPKLNFFAAVGKEFDKVHIRVYQADGETDFKLYYEIVLTNAVISSLATSGGSEDTATETMTLNFTQISWTYKKQGVDVAQLGQSSYEFDLMAAKGKGS